MSSDFHFSLLRISTAQIFRAAGIDRCNPTVLDTVTDIVMRHLLLLSNTCTELSSASGRSEVNITDLAEAMVSIGLIRPAPVIDTSAVEIVAEELAEGDDVEPPLTSPEIAGFIKFLDWAKGQVPADARTISRMAVPQGPSLSNTSSTAVVPTLSAPPGGAPDAAPETSTGNLESAPNPLDPTTQSAATSIPPVVSGEWLTALMRKQVKVGHEKRFQGTVLSEDDSEVQNDYKIAGGPASLEEAMEYFDTHKTLETSIA